MYSKSNFLSILFDRVLVDMEKKQIPILYNKINNTKEKF